MLRSDKNQNICQRHHNPAALADNKPFTQTVNPQINTKKSHTHTNHNCEDSAGVTIYNFSL